MEIQSSDDRVSRHGRSHDFLRGFPAILVEGNSVFTVLASQHLIESLLQSFSSLGLRPKYFMIVNDSVRSPARFSAIPNNLSRDLSIRINAHIKRTQSDTCR